jgi:hypothetical protein
MATTGLTALGDSTFATIVQSDVIDELRPANTSKQFLRRAVAGASAAANFVLYGDLGPSGVIGTTPSDELTDITSTAMTDSTVAVTADEGGFRIDVADFVREVSIQGDGLIADATRMLVAGLNERWETDLAALMDDFTNITTCASTMTAADLLAAVSALEQRDIPGPYVAYLDPKQSGELRAEIASSTASYLIGRDGDLVSPFADSGFFGTYMGVPIWQSSLTVTTGTLVGGAVFQSGVALGYLEIRPNRIEPQRDASLRALELVATQVYGLAEVSDTRGQTIKSVA